MSAERPDPAVIDYIRANRDRFGREEIDAALRASGHAPEAIAAAWAALVAEEVSAASPPMADTPAEPFLPAGEPAPAAGRDPAIDAYIREQRGTYNRAAITTSLVESGHAPEEIEAAWRAVLAADAPPPTAPDVPESGRRAAMRSWRFWVAALAAFLALIVLPPALTAAFPDRPVGAGIGLALLIGIVGAALIMFGIGRARDVAYGLLAGVLALIGLLLAFALLAFVLFVILLGVCFVLLGQSIANP